MSDKATPRPWTVNGFGGDFVVICQLHGVAICATSPRGDEIENARLIVSAVNAYEAHRRAAEALRAIVDDNEAACDCTPHFLAPCVWCEARAALAELDKVLTR